jgi:hypothetical protein
MTDPEREHLVQRIKDLEGSRARWRVACLALLGLFLLPVVCGGLLGVAWVPRLERQRAEIEQVREAEYRARVAAEEALQQADRERVAAEEEARRRAQERPGKDKE